jgi:hypothetical protein
VPLPDRAFKASLDVIDAPAKLLATQKQRIYVTPKNISETTWPSLCQSDGNYSVGLGNHWLDDPRDRVKWTNH